MALLHHRKAFGRRVMVIRPEEMVFGHHGKTIGRRRIMAGLSRMMMGCRGKAICGHGKAMKRRRQVVANFVRNRHRQAQGSVVKSALIPGRAAALPYQCSVEPLARWDSAETADATAKLRLSWTAASFPPLPSDEVNREIREPR